MSAKNLTLPLVAGDYLYDFRISNWLGLDVKSEILYKPRDAEDLAKFMYQRQGEGDCKVFGGGSNLILSKSQVPGIAIKLSSGFNYFKLQGNKVVAGSGVLSVNLAKFALFNGLSGLEFLSGIPGSLGGALAMNAGAYGSSISQVLEGATLVDNKGNFHYLSSEEIGYRYRGHSLCQDSVFIEGVFKCTYDSPELIEQRMQEIKASRLRSQPINQKTAGSTFKNPPSLFAWKLIEQAGLRGRVWGRAKISELHCNFLINQGGASGSELLELGMFAQSQVKSMTGIELEWEVKII